MSKHTQGRFYTEQTASSTFATRAIYAERPDGSDVLVAHVGIPGPEERRPSVHEDVANADLFAAAPDMLAALKAFAEPGQPVSAHVIEMARAAIRKAEGKL